MLVLILLTRCERGLSFQSRCGHQHEYAARRNGETKRIECFVLAFTAVDSCQFGT